MAAASAMAKMGRAMKNFPIPVYFFNRNDPHSLTKFLQTGHSDRFSRFQARLDGPHSAERLARRNLAVFGRAVRPDYPDRRYVESLHDTLLRHQYTGQLRPDIGFDTRELSGLEPVGRIREADDQHDRPRSRRYGRPGVIVLAEKRIAGTVRLVKHDLRKQFGVVVDIRPIAVQPKELRHRNRNGDLDRINIHNRGEGRNLRTRTDIITDGAVRRFDNAVYLCIDLRVAQIELGIPQSLPGRLHVGLRSGVLRRILVELRTADGIDLGQRHRPVEIVLGFERQRTARLQSRLSRKQGSVILTVVDFENQLTLAHGHTFFIVPGYEKPAHTGFDHHFVIAVDLGNEAPPRIEQIELGDSDFDLHRRHLPGMSGTGTAGNREQREREQDEGN